MCGIAGVLTKNDPRLLDQITRMGEVLAHRGPDSNGQWKNSEDGIAVTHQRLSIVDLSRNGSQPMHSHCGRWVIVFNGEIYNHSHLRRAITQASEHIWQGSSDTETLVECISVWGIEKTLYEIEGMFAFAVWDKKVKRLYLARDRFGEKPLFYHLTSSTFLFGSELAALKIHSSFSNNVDRRSAAQFLEQGYSSGEATIYQGTKRLLPGHWISFDINNFELSPPIEYWSALNTMKNGFENTWKHGRESYISKLELLLEKAVGDTLMSDAPTGVFLSGGIDSSLIALFAQMKTVDPIKTFSIGFENDKYNESTEARIFSEFLGTDHTYQIVTDHDARKLIPSLSNIYGEPFADSSQIPSLLVAQLASEQVKVCLSGDGGDELFNGYPRYAETRKIANNLFRSPKSLRFALSKAIKVLSRVLNSSDVSQDVALRIYNKLSIERLSKISSVLESSSTLSLYKVLIKHHWITNLKTNYNLGDDEKAIAFVDHDLEKFVLQAYDILTYLPDNILVKMDRACMSWSVENRSPFLNADVFKHAWKIPAVERTEYGDLGKWPLRMILSKHAPSEIVKRPKRGFGVPVNNWIKGALRNDILETLMDKTSHDEEIISSKALSNIVKHHFDGTRENVSLIWNLYFYFLWRSNNA